MKSRPQFVLALAFAFAVGADARAQQVACGRLLAEVNNLGLTSSFNACSPEPSGENNPIKITRFATRFDGDHSLEAMTVGEQLFARYSLYTVRLQFASGAEQSLAVTAPPGGLRPEMRDMSGDDVPNDVVLTSGLLRLPLIVLLNEGHDHLTVPISPRSFSSGGDRASGPGLIHQGSALRRSGFRSPELGKDSGFFSPQPRESSFAGSSRAFPNDAGHTSTSGRAPPALRAQS